MFSNYNLRTVNTSKMKKSPAVYILLYIYLYFVSGIFKEFLI